MANKTFEARIKNKKDSSANFTKSNPVLIDGEIIAVTTDNGTRLKVGDGTKTYTELPFIDEPIYDKISKLPIPPAAATATPKAPGTAAVGSSAKYAKEDHVHPLQTTVSGNAGSATKLTTSAGSATKPVYFSDGKPVAITHSLNADVPENAKFTDTTYSDATASVAGLMSAADKAKLDGISSGANAVAASTTTPKAPGTAAVGSETKYARGDHVHPAQTSVSGNAGTATKLATAREIRVSGAITGAGNFDGSGNLNISTSPSNFVFGGNEINLISTLDQNKQLHINYRQNGGNNTNGYKIIRYLLDDGAGSTLAYIEKNFFSGTAASANTATNATTASKLGTSDVGSATQPVYLDAGVPKACTYTLGKSVPANAVFTDTNTWRPLGTGADQACAGNDARLSNARPASDVYSWAKASSKPSYSASEVGALATGTRGAANGVASLDANGKVPSSQLPSYVDDVLEYAGMSKFPATGETGKIYVDTTTNKTYRWSGSAYVEISASLALGTTSSTAFAGDKGNTAYAHATAKGSAFASGLYKITTNAQGHVTAATAVTKADITGLGIPGSDTNTWIAFKGATTSAAGTAGYIPAPAAGAANRYLRSDGTWAVPPDTNTDTHWTTGIAAGVSGTATNSAATNPYIKVKDNSTYRSQVRLIGSGATTVTSDANGNITISSTDTNTNTDTKVSITNTNSSGDATYYIPFNKATSSSATGLLANDGLRYWTKQGTTSVNGLSELGLGNNIATGTEGNKTGHLYMYGNSSGYTIIMPSNHTTSNITVYLPPSDGTLALTSSNITGNAASATKLQTARTINGVSFDGTKNITVADSTKLPLSGGTLTGRLNANGKINTVSTAGSWVSGMTPANNSIWVSTQQTTSSYHPYFGVKTSSGNVVNMGGLGDEFGFYGFKNGRTENATDWKITVNSGTGAITTAKSIIASGGFIGNASSASKWFAARTLSWSGDASGSMSVDGSANKSATLTLAASGVTADTYGPTSNATPAHSGSFSVPSFTVDAKGRITSAATRTITLPALPSASTSAKGIVQLSSAINSTSASLAATPAAVKQAYERVYVGAAEPTASSTVIWIDTDATNNSVLSISNGGTGATNSTQALKNLLSSGNLTLSSYQYGTSLPQAGTVGRVFFKKV